MTLLRLLALVHTAGFQYGDRVGPVGHCGECRAWLGVAFLLSRASGLDE